MKLPYSNESESINQSINANKLTVHPAKSKFIIFHPRRKQILNSSDINIFINNSLITRVQEDKFLGIIIHENLSWKPHISAVCDKVFNVIGVLCKSRRFLPLNTLKSLYNFLFLPYINYCSLPPFSLIRDFRKENTRGNVSKISVNHACYRGQKVTLVAVIGGFRSDLSITCMIDGHFGNVSAGVLFSKVAYQRKRW